MIGHLGVIQYPGFQGQLQLDVYRRSARNYLQITAKHTCREATRGNMARIGYARVSTEEQNLDLQKIALEANHCDLIVTDQGISGSRADRPGLRRVLECVQAGDTVVVWRLDRLGRSLTHLVGLMADFRVRGIHFASLNEAIDTSTPTGMFVFHMIAALAEFERALISERTRAGMAAARVRGVKLGRPRNIEHPCRNDDSDRCNPAVTERPDPEACVPTLQSKHAMPEPFDDAHVSDEASEDEPGSVPRPQ